MTPAQFAYHVTMASRTLPHGERPTAKHLRIARIMARWQHRTPAHGQLARASRCSVRTVQNALQRLRGLGMISWRAQYRPLRSGGRHQLANRYLFLASFAPPPCTKQEKIQNPISPVGKLPEIAPEARAALLLKWGLA